MKKRKAAMPPAQQRLRNVDLALSTLANMGIQAPIGFDAERMPDDRRAADGHEALGMMRDALGLAPSMLTASARQVRSRITEALTSDELRGGLPRNGTLTFRYAIEDQAFPVDWGGTLELPFETFMGLTATDTHPVAEIEAIRRMAEAKVARKRNAALKMAEQLRRMFDGRFEDRRVTPVQPVHAAKPDMNSVQITSLINSYIATHHKGDRAAEERRRMAIEDPRLLHLDAPVRPRHVLALLGPTNSGKTHEGLNLLVGADSGAYLGPLRLMALENHEAIVGRGVACSLLTGEEEILDPEARHVSATVEMFEQSRHWGTVLIDEIQMLADPDRGWAWSRAFLSASTDLLIVAGSPDAEPLIRRLAEMNGDTVEVKRFERRNALDVHPAKVGWDELRKGDAIIAFSRDDVLGYKSLAESRGFRAAAVYGALGPEARHEQARRFREGDVDVLVATDAIGMGLNLPIDRVLFTRLNKFDGREERTLTPSETRQVAGRAGRFSSTKPGIVAVMKNAVGSSDKLEKLINGPSSIDKEAPFPMQPGWAVVARIIEERALTLENALALVANALLGHKDASYTMTDDVMEILRIVNGPGHAPDQRFRHLGLPLSLRSMGNKTVLSGWVRKVNAGSWVGAPSLAGIKPGVTGDTNDLRRLEDAVQQAGAYLWLHRRFPDRYPQAEAAMDTRKIGTQHISAILSQKTVARPCSSCGNQLPAGHRFPICDSCHSGRQYADY